MNIVITFEQPMGAEKLRHNLRNVKKICSVLRHYVCHMTDDLYFLASDGSVVCEFSYLIDEEKRQVTFSNFKGKHRDEIEQMLGFRMIEEIGQKAVIKNLRKKMEIYFDFESFYLKEENGVYKIGLDWESIIPIGLAQVPKELKEDSA